MAQALLPVHPLSGQNPGSAACRADLYGLPAHTNYALRVTGCSTGNLGANVNLNLACPSRNAASTSSGVSPPRKQKSQITRSLRPGRDVVMQSRGDLQIRDSRNPPRLFRACHFFQNPAARHRNHQHPRGRFFPRRILPWQMQRVPQQQLFQANRLAVGAPPKPQCPRAKSANRARLPLRSATRLARSGEILRELVRASNPTLARPP